MSKKKRLAIIMAEYGVSASDVSKILGRRMPTIYGWTSKNGPNPPEDALFRLEKELERRGEGHNELS